MKSSKLWMGIPLIILVFTVVLGVVLTGCDPLPDEDLIVGKWYRTQQLAEAGGQAPFEFTNDSRLIYKSGSTTTYYKYKIVGASLEIYDQGGSQKYDDTTPYTVSDTELVISKKVGPLAKTTYYRKGSSSSGQPSEPENKAAMPYADPIGATYTSAQTVTLKSDTTGAEIYYTTTGTDPTKTNGIKYGTTAISISATTTLKAIAIKDGLTDSDVMTEVYTISGSTPTPTAPAAPTASPPPGTFPSAQTVTLTAETGASIFYTTNGTDPTSSSTPYTTTGISVASTTTIKAIAVKDSLTSSVFSGTYTISSGGGKQSIINVTSSADTAGSATTVTLRYAINNIADNGTININLTGGGTIELGSQLPTISATGIKINGNGVIIKPNSSYASTGNSLMLVGLNSVVDIYRIHFQSGKDNTSTGSGAAIYNRGNITVNSCIFTLNSTGLGGALYNTNVLTVRGCSFYSNTATVNGGAIYNNAGTLSLVGNIFFMNKAPSGATTAGPIVFKKDGTVTSNGYNLVDVELGTGANQCGWTPQSTDKKLSDLGSIASPFVDAPNGNFTPAINTTLNTMLPSTVPSQFPTTDFKGETRTFPGSPGAIK